MSRTQNPESEPRTIIVTGGASGIGQAIVGNLMEKGYLVISLDVQYPRAEWTVPINAGSVQVHHDVRDYESFEQILGILRESERPASGLVNCAAILSLGPVMAMERDSLRAMMEVNFDAAAFLTVALARDLKAAGESGSIVNISSIHAVLSEPAAAPYAASKGALEAFSRTAASELAPIGIRVNCVRPGAIDTPMSRPTYSQAVRRGLKGRIPMGRLGVPEEVAGAVEFLLSSQAAYITGSIITVDGGFSMHGGLPDATYSY